MFALAHPLAGADSDRRARRLAQYRRYNYSEKGRARNARYDATPAGVARKLLYERTVRDVMRSPSSCTALDVHDPHLVRGAWADVVRGSVEQARQTGEDPERIAEALRWAMLPARLLDPPAFAYIRPFDLLLTPTDWQQLSLEVAKRIGHLVAHGQTLTLPEMTRIGRALALLRTDDGVRALSAGGMDAIRRLAAGANRLLQLTFGHPRPGQPTLGLFTLGQLTVDQPAVGQLTLSQLTLSQLAFGQLMESESALPRLLTSQPVRATAMQT